MTCQWMSRSRTLAASSTQRLVSHAHGHSGSNQKSTRAVVGALCTASVIGGAPREIGWRLGPRVVRPWKVSSANCCSLNDRSGEGLTGSSSARGKLARVAVPNLTRDDAAARAELLAVQSYDLSLDVTDGAGHPGDKTFRSTTTVEFSCRRPGADSFIDLIAEQVRSAPLDGQVVSNTGGRTIETGPGGAQLVHFAPTKRISTYLVALIAGPYARVTDEHDGIALGLYCRASLAKFLDPDELFRVTKQGFDFYHRVFDYRYPFDKYDQLFVPEFNAGAMENAGAVTFLEDYVFRSKVSDARRERRAVTILHEMAHMWFGDLVTMRWWDDLWLNESFATYASVLAQVSANRWKNAWTTFATTEKSWAARQDQLPSTHPIVADAVDMEAVKTNFDGITYAKGASVLKQLVAWVGQEEFLSGLRSYFRQHEYSNTTLRDLLDALEVASGRNLGAWSREWLETTGVNTLQPRFETDSSGLFTTFDIVQEAPAEHPTLRSHRLAVGLYDKGPSGELVRRERVELDVTGALTEVPKLLGARQPDLVLVN